MQPSPTTPRRRRLAVLLLVLGGLLIVGIANAHLVWVSFASQPECVEHLRGPGAAPGEFRAARSSCSP